MALSTLSMTLADYRTAAIAELGYGSTAYGSLDAGEAAEIDRLIKRAERTFWLHPPVDPPHVWSCLRKKGLLDLWADIEGATELIVNGNFQDDDGTGTASGWTLGTNWSIESARATAVAASSDLSQTTAPLTVGSTYTVTFSIVTTTVGSVTAKCGTTSGTSRSGVGTYCENILCAGNGGFKLTAAGFSGTVDGVSAVLSSALPGSGTTVSKSASTLFASTDTFYETMVGKGITVYGNGSTGGGAFTITAFLTPAAVTLDTSTGSFATRAFSILSNGAFRLPVDFESTDTASLRFTEETSRAPIRLMEERDVTALRASDTSTGCPQVAAIRWAITDGSAAHQQELYVWPTPDQHYRVAMPYNAQPLSMGASTDYPNGGPEMADGLLSMVLAICEEAKNGQRGDRWLEAMQKIRASAYRDMRKHHNFIAGSMRSDAGAYTTEFDAKRLVLPTA